MTESELRILGSSNQAAIALDLLKPFLDKERLNIISKMKQMGRSDKHDFSVYIGMISTLNSLDDLEGQIVRTINKAMPINKKVMSINGD